MDLYSYTLNTFTKTGVPKTQAVAAVDTYLGPRKAQCHCSKGPNHATYYDARGDIVAEYWPTTIFVEIDRAVDTGECPLCHRIGCEVC